MRGRVFRRPRRTSDDCHVEQMLAPAVEVLIGRRTASGSGRTGESRNPGAPSHRSPAEERIDERGTALQLHSRAADREAEKFGFDHKTELVAVVRKSREMDDG